ncbi:complement component 1 Q subcomponent-binding protein, mitochondrial [Macrosteles quadrilineatus]|uniref:complement component 1 Q subcomponent-binding protein, mitochondrial n=1 Tax=Macrosteles quadrilineatus TaxID=74068 RepID=UPI0023E0EC64|nr:complement component 1 Q subcomponent-binding protein, mitochondrial [Macrosteles quadrilineatus]
MNGIVKTVFRVSSLKSFSNLVRHNVSGGPAKRQFARTLWHMCNRNDFSNNLQLSPPSTMCSCGCGSMKAHTKAEKELVEFLNEEIAAEKKLQKTKTIPSEVCGFKVTLEGSEVTLTKSTGEETIEINFNVNHSVDTDMEPEMTPNMDKPEIELRSKPQFEVDIKRGKKTMGFTCSFVNTSGQDEHQDDNYSDDIFGIDEVTCYEGEWQDSNYAVSGEVLDGYLYDLFMNLLEEKGVTNELMEKVSDFATAYEHSSYIGMLEKVQHFAAGK